MPFAEPIGLEIVEAGPERVTGRMTVRPDRCTAEGILHRGAVMAMAMADAPGAAAAVLARPEGAAGATTVESKADVLGPA